MRRNQRRPCGGQAWGVVTLLALVTGLATGCMVTGQIRGQVLDAQTRQPLPGAIALAVWTTAEGVPGLTYTKLLGVQEAEVDVQGRFTLERPAGGVYGAHESVTVYKFGYTAWNNREIFPTYQRREDTQVPAEIRLDTFPLGANHIRHVDFLSHVTGGVGLSSRAPMFWKAARPEELMK